MAKRPVLLFACFGVDADAWLNQLRAQLPEVELRVWPEVGDGSQVDYVLAWNAPSPVWEGLTGLKAIFSLGAGVDRLLKDPALPVGPPVVSMDDPSLVVGMREYVLARVLHYHRDFAAYASAQAQGAWRPERLVLAGERKVGIMGLGRLGGACARSLVELGFDVLGWSRSPQHIDGLRSFAGREALGDFAANAEILVCLLPLTPETEGVLNSTLFARLPRGARLINVARGAHLVEADLLDALASGQIAEATLDVFAAEPLPADHPFWSHPKVTVTPHVSAVTHPRTAIAALAANLRRLEADGRLEKVVDRAAGY